MNNERQYDYPSQRQHALGLKKRDREWRDYPEGTKAHAYNGGAWLRTNRGWQWNGHTRNPGSTFPTPGADAFCYCVELPANVELTGLAPEKGD